MPAPTAASCASASRQARTAPKKLSRALCASSRSAGARHVRDLDAEQPRKRRDPARGIVLTPSLASSGPSRVNSFAHATSVGSPSTIAHSARSISLSGQ